MLSSSQGDLTAKEPTTYIEHGCTVAPLQAQPPVFPTAHLSSNQLGLRNWRPSTHLRLSSDGALRLGASSALYSRAARLRHSSTTTASGRTACQAPRHRRACLQTAETWCKTGNAKQQNYNV